jgi:uncharacterized protein DUF6526
MSEKVPQTRANHMRFDPWFHFVLAPGLFLFLIWTVVHFVRHMGSEPAMFVVIALLLFLMAFRVRPYALRVQDRIIRLEERLRLERLCGRIPELTESQWIALRFASDEEAVALAERAARERWKPKQIKDAIQTWRGDYWRV